MNRSLITLMSAFLLVLQLGLAADQEKPEVVIAKPPAEAALSIKVWLEKDSYEIGERLGINFIISRDCYVYIYDISSQGRATLLLPNAFRKNNLLEAGHYTLPDDRYSLVAEGQPGLEYIQAIASVKPISVLVAPQSAYKETNFATVGTDAGELKVEVEKGVENLPPREWAADWTSFRLLPPGLAWVVIDSEPRGVEARINGELVGSTPLAASTEPGFSRIVLRKEGYGIWSERIYLERNEVAEIEAHLEKATPSTSMMPPASMPQTPSREVSGKPLAALEFNLGIDGESLGAEVGLRGGLRVGTAARFTGDPVPDYYEVPPPAKPWPDAEVYNDGPETEFYLKLAAPLGERLALVIGGGLAVQEQVHIATPESQGVLPLDIAVKPNGYKAARNYLTVFGGFLLKFEPFFLELDCHNRRGWAMGIGIGF